MPTLCVNKTCTKLGLKSERIEITGPDEQGRDTLLRAVPIRDIERVLITESVHITNRTLTTLLKRQIPVAIIGWNGKYIGGFHPPSNTHGLIRLSQYRKNTDPHFGLQIAGRILAAKTYNQRRALQRLAKNRNRQNKEPEQNQPHATTHAIEKARRTADQLQATLATLGQAKTIETLRGTEGLAAAAYYAAWAQFLPDTFPFERRSRRPPLNPVNACISFGATLIYNETVSALHAHGLDPALGHLHATENNRWSLALDLMEPYRPVLIEALTLDLFSHNMLTQKHFEDKKGGVYLTEEGRRIFIQQYESRMERQFMSETIGHRTTLRRQLEKQATQYKTSLENPADFQPFLMN